MTEIAAHCGTHPIRIQGSYLDSYLNYIFSVVFIRVYNCSRCSFSACTVVHSGEYVYKLAQVYVKIIIFFYKDKEPMNRSSIKLT